MHNAHGWNETGHRRVTGSELDDKEELLAQVAEGVERAPQSPLA